MMSPLSKEASKLYIPNFAAFLNNMDFHYTTENKYHDNRQTTI